MDGWMEGPQPAWRAWNMCICQKEKPCTRVEERGRLANSLGVRENVPCGLGTWVMSPPQGRAVCLFGEGQISDK